MAYDVRITWLPLHSLFDLKGTETALAAWCGTALPAFPETPNSRSIRGGHELLWVGPDHWLLRAPIDAEDGLLAGLRPDAAPSDISVVLISDTLDFFSVAGPDAGAVMAVVTPLDLHVQVFGCNRASFTEGLGVKLLLTHEADGFRLGVDQSHADWFADYLARIAG